MYKVIIIDDEAIIVEGMRKVIPWEEYNCEVVGTAEDGLDGARLVKELKPDIIFTDIYMPGMDGLAMIAAIKSEFPEIEVSILTGFREFNYAKDAIRLGVTRFLVKPSILAEVREALEAMILKIDERKKQTLDKKEIDNAGNKNKKAEFNYDEAEDKAEDKADKKIDNEEIAAAGSFVVGNAIKYLKGNYMHKIKLSDIAEQVYVSQWHLSRLIKQYTGRSFYDLIYDIRIDKAKELLRDPALRIGEIAEQVGFQDLTHFSKIFRKLEGMSANEYRNFLK